MRQCTTACRAGRPSWSASPTGRRGAWAGRAEAGWPPRLRRRRAATAGGSASCSDSVCAGASGAQLAFEDLVDLRRIGLAAAGLHDLANQRVEGLVLAGAELLDGLGVGGEHLVDHRFDRARVGDLLEPLSLDDFVGTRAVAVPQGIEDLAADAVRNRVVGDALHQAGD